MTGEPGVPFIQAANHWDGREGQTPRYIILHGTAGFSRAVDCANFFANPATQASAHYIVGLDGGIIQCVDEADAAWSNGPITGKPGTSGDGIHHDSWWDSGINPNLLTIAIEHIKPHIDNSDVLTDAQKAASFQLVRHICQRWQIPMRPADSSGGITGHYSMDPVNRSRCPGPYPWDALWQFLKGTTSMIIPRGWKYDSANKILTAPNGIMIRAGFAECILNYPNGWDANNIPMAPEEARAQHLELGNPSIKGGTRQLFRGTQGYPALLEWTADTGVFIAYAGQELYAVEQLLKQYTTAANVTQVAQSLKAIVTVAEQLQNDANMLEETANTGLKALGQ